MFIPSSPAKAPNTPGADHLAALRPASKLPEKLEIVNCSPQFSADQNATLLGE